jgi:PKD repeat protein
MYTKVGTYTVSLYVRNLQYASYISKRGLITVQKQGPTPTPTITPTVTPTASPTPTPTETVTPSPTPEQIVASFNASPLTGKAPLTVKFTDTSTGIPVRWYWNFGDGTQSSIQNPLKTYQKPGIYTVLLYVRSGTNAGVIQKKDLIQVTNANGVLEPSIVSSSASPSVIFTPGVDFPTVIPPV